MNSFSFPNLILGLIGIALGVWITYSAYHINHHILFAGWVEKKWGPGTGTTFYRLLGVVISLFSILVLIGIIDLFGAAFGSTTNSSNSRTRPNGETRLVPGGTGSGRGRIAD